MQSHVPATPLQTLESEAGFAQHREWERTLSSGNWGMITWPKEYGGHGANLIDWLIFEEEYYRAGGPAAGERRTASSCSGRRSWSSAPRSRRTRFLPHMAEGDDLWAQGWSEPNSGLILPAARHAVRDERPAVDVSPGTRSGPPAAPLQTGVRLFRTDQAAERHKGMSFCSCR